MDNTKRLMTATLLAMIVLIGWQYWMAHYLKEHPPQGPVASNAPPSTSPTTAASGTQPGTVESSSPSTTAAAMTAATASAPSPSVAAGLQAVGGQAERAVIGSDQLDKLQKGPFALGLDISPQGASISRVTVNEFVLKVGKTDPFAFQEPYLKETKEEDKFGQKLKVPYDPSETRIRALATRTIVIDGKPVDVGALNWKLDSRNTDEKSSPPTSSATYSVEINDAAGNPLLDVKKTFTVVGRSTPAMGFEVPLRYSIINRADHPLTVRTVFNGPNEIASENTRDYVQIVGAYPDGSTLLAVPYQVQSFKSDNQDLTKYKDKPLLWAGCSGSYFDAILRIAPNNPKQPAPALASVGAMAINPDAGEKDVAITFETADMQLAAGQSEELSFTAFFGPKAHTVLQDGKYYEFFPRQYDKTLVLVNSSSWFSWFCGLCTFQWLVNVLVTMLGIIHHITFDWGLAIIGLVVIVRLLLHPITKRSQVSMMRMQKMGPEIERLKKKYGDNKDELNKAMVEVYKTQGMAPVLGCLPIFLQMPIWIALWNALQSTFEMWHAPLHFTWIHDLSKPDALYSFAHPIPLVFGMHLDAINVLPILMVIVTYFNQKYMPQPVAATPEAAQQQKMMKGMSLLFPLMFYPMPSGLNLYYVTSMGLGIIESKRIRAHIKEREEAEKTGRVLVDARPTRSGRQMAKDARLGAKAQPPKGGITGWLADLQRRAEELRNETDKKKKRR